MRPIVDKERWYFVDEAGDPVFYGKGKKCIVGTEGCSRTFSVGFGAQQELASRAPEK
jgi:hypothetical protein